MDERRARWTILVEGFPPFTMVGEPMTWREALECAQSIWPGCLVL